MTDSRQQGKKYWYSISVESLRAFFILGGLAAALVVGVFGYRTWERSFEQREAAHRIEEARALAERLEKGGSVGSFRREYGKAMESYREARSSYEGESFAAALAAATSSRNLLQMIYDSLTGNAGQGDARFLTVDGGVEFRRGEAGAWETARGRISLAYGDYVRTEGGGSAAIMLADGALYTIRPNTLVKIGGIRRTSSGGTEQSMEMEYGWVNLSTRNQESNVSTPEAEAKVERQSEASVSYDRDSRTGLFASYKGGLRVSSRDGEAERRVGNLEQVVQRREKLSQPETLPSGPELLAPADGHQVRFGSAESLYLDWTAVPAAKSYALQVSRSSLFVDNVIDRRDRPRRGATLGIRGEGAFLWRVAAVDGNGVQGPWSAVRKFRVTSLGVNAARDDTPPQLQLVDIKPYGNIFIVTGIAEPGAEVEINGEPVTVAADGTFTKSVQFADAGWKPLFIRARDAWGNETEHREKVYVEPF